jgi:hypothetical protein
VVGAIPPADRVATVETVAANAVMAGALAEHLPIIIAAVEGMLEEPFNLRGVQCTTHRCAPLVIVSGPCVERLGIATAESVFGASASRASHAIGRALRLLLWNCGGAVTGGPVGEVFGPCSHVRRPRAWRSGERTTIRASGWTAWPTRCARWATTARTRWASAWWPSRRRRRATWPGAGSPVRTSRRSYLLEDDHGVHARLRSALPAVIDAIRSERGP